MKQICDLERYLSMTPSELAGSVLHCAECGRDHVIPINLVHCEADLISGIPDLIEDILGSRANKVGVIYDKHIEEKIFNLCLKRWDSHLMDYVRIPLGTKNCVLEASEEIGDQAAERLPDGIDFLVGVGSGVISDLTKWIATQKSLPYLLLGTAASMNAYTSITASMTKDKIKTTKDVDIASAVLLDPGMLQTAPKEMTCAGVGDLLARNIANADWKLSQMIRGTNFCSVPFQLMQKYQEFMILKIEEIKKNEMQGIKTLADAILISGYSMTMLAGETSPSSGTEHVLSHFFDYQHEIYQLPKNYHGTQVGLGTIIMGTAFDILRSMTASDFNIDEILERRPSKSARKEEHRRIFGDDAVLFDDVMDKKRINDLDFPEYIKGIIDDWDVLWDSVTPYLMPSDEIRMVMEKLGAAIKLSEINRSQENTIQALLFGSLYRSRYTILDLFWELGLFPKYAQIILEKSGVLA